MLIFLEGFEFVNGSYSYYGFEQKNYTVNYPGVALGTLSVATGRNSGQSMYNTSANNPSSGKSNSTTTYSTVNFPLKSSISSGVVGFAAQFNSTSQTSYNRLFFALYDTNGFVQFYVVKSGSNFVLYQPINSTSKSFNQGTQTTIVPAPGDNPWTAQNVVASNTNGTTTWTPLATSSGLSINDSTWYYVEISFTLGSGGGVQIRVNGTQVLSYSTSNFSPTGTGSTYNNLTGMFSLGYSLLTQTTNPFAPSTTNQSHAFDDVYVLDTTGSVNNTFLGDCYIETILPTSDVSVQWSRQGGQASNALTVGRNYISSYSQYVVTSSNYTDTYGVTSYVNGNSIFGIKQLITGSNNGSPANYVLTPFLKIGGTTYNSSTMLSFPSQAQNTGAQKYNIINLNPSNSSLWTQSDLSSMNVGMSIIQSAAIQYIEQYGFEVLRSASSAAAYIGTANGSSTASGVGNSLVNSVFSANGSSTASGTSKSLVSSIGTANGSSTASGTSKSLVSSIGTASGDSTASGTSKSLVSSIGTANGSSTSSGTSNSLINSVFAANGDSTASGTSKSLINSVFNANGDSTASGTSKSLINSIGTANGDSTASGTSKSLINSVFNANGDSTASGTGTSKSSVSSVGTANGNSTASGTSKSLINSVFNANGDSTGIFVGVSTLPGNSVANASGNSQAIAVGKSNSKSIGNANGGSTANGVGKSLVYSVGTANGNSTAKAIYAPIFYFYPDGGEVLTGGIAYSNYILKFNKIFIWQTNAKISINQDFVWSVGKTVSHWYRIQGACQNTNPGCDLIGIQTDDPKCVNGKQQFVQNILAKSLTDVCNQLTNSRLNWEVTSIKKWSRPADPTLVSKDDQCNSLTEVPFCQIPQCLNFCVQTHAVIHIGATNYSFASLVPIEGSGVAYLGGEADTNLVDLPPPTFSSFDYSPSIPSAILTGGQAIASCSWNPECLIFGGINTIIDMLEPVFGYDTSVPEFVLPNLVVGTNCGCESMPLTLYLFHNLGNDNVLVNFLKRNGFVLPNYFSLNYNSKTISWIGNYHLTGIGDNNTQDLENWKISFEWACVNSIAGDELESYSWKFSMFVNRTIKNGINYNTRMLTVFPSEQICLNLQNLNSNFNFQYNVSTNYIENELGIISNFAILTDNIGIFKSKFWNQNPNFNVTLSQNNVLTQIPKKDIYSIFPQ